MKTIFRLAGACCAASVAIVSNPAAAQEVFTGIYVHGVDTPFSLETEEGGADIALGYRFGRQDALSIIGRPAPYLIASVNTQGDTSFAGGGLSWKIGKGPVWVRPGLGLVLHDGPSERFSVGARRTDLGSRVLFEPEIAIGTQVTPRLGVEASWVHVSHARLFNSQQNPGIDMMGVRLTLDLR
ncbi:acyloxyacyl hydrolase [Altericroceibacterium xinjiangense]|uniref:acyloxyacyl hydrolase n=1 Tax=Altericroceibacterium xinjiangense TaxID=762261 RepID=UPI000F7DB97E|nr:acyloxyacyl hydrolase [Altericroceibacterium xinjiangense]